MAKSGKNLGPDDMSSDISPARGMSVVKSVNNIGPVDLSSDIPPARGI